MKSLWRKSFLRGHIAGEIERKERFDVLAVEELLRKVEAQKITGLNRSDCHDLWNAINPRRFFYEIRPDERLYVPVRVQPVGDWHRTDQVAFASKKQEQERQSGEALRKRTAYWAARHRDEQHDGPEPRVPTFHPLQSSSYTELTDLLYWMEQPRTSQKGAPRDERGVLLVSRSGAGKTTACRKAFWDCLVSTPEDSAAASPPRLKGRLPVILETDSGNAVATPLPPLDRVIEALLQASQLPDSARQLIRQYVQYSPPLLMFVDLNRYVEDFRTPLAESFVAFQEQYGQLGHRGLLTLRSVSAGSPSLRLLQNQNGRYFGTYNLLPLDLVEGQGYLQNLRKTEESLFNVVLPNRGLRFHARVIEAEINLLTELHRQHVACEPAHRDAGLISTPLLMHLVSVAPASVLQPDTTLTQLIDAVVELFLSRDITEYSRDAAAAGLNRESMHVVMTRLALAIQEQGPGQTRISREVLLGLLQTPPVDPLTHNTPDWIPLEMKWLGNAIYGPAAGPSAPIALLDRDSAANDIALSLVVYDGDGVGFFHDSLIGYYAGAYGLLRFHFPNTRVLSADWCCLVAERIAGSPKEAERWQPAALALAGGLVPVDRQRARSKRPELLIPLLLKELLLRTQDRAQLELVRRFVQASRKNDYLRVVSEVLDISSTFLQSNPQETLPTVVSTIGMTVSLPKELQTWAKGLCK